VKVFGSGIRNYASHSIMGVIPVSNHGFYGMLYNNSRSHGSLFRGKGLRKNTPVNEVARPGG
jgi:hypothetical protein